MKQSDKKQIAKEFGNNWTYLESWFEVLAYVRNICAHYGRLYNVRLDKTPKLSPKDKNLTASTIRVFSALLCLRHLAAHDETWLEFTNNINRLFLMHPEVKKEKIGFPDNWQDILMSE